MINFCVTTYNKESAAVNASFMLFFFYFLPRPSQLWMWVGDFATPSPSSPAESILIKLV